jgi:hypothetical protein
MRRRGSSRCRASYASCPSCGDALVTFRHLESHYGLTFCPSCPTACSHPRLLLPGRQQCPRRRRPSCSPEMHRPHHRSVWIQDRDRPLQDRLELQELRTGPVPGRTGRAGRIGPVVAGVGHIPGHRTLAVPVHRSAAVAAEHIESGRGFGRSLGCSRPGVERRSPAVGANTVIALEGRGSEEY